MKLIGTLIGTFFVLSLLSQAALAKELRIYLDCKIDDPKAKAPKDVAEWKVVKISTPVKEAKKGENKWENRYSLEVVLKGKNIVEVFDFEPMSGDEDYNEYDVIAANKDFKRIGVGAVTVHNRFEWASLVSDEGYKFADCGKK